MQLLAPKKRAYSRTWAGNVAQIHAAFQILKEMLQKTEDKGFNLKNGEMDLPPHDMSGNLIESSRSMSLPETIGYLNHQVPVLTKLLCCRCNFQTPFSTKPEF